MRITFTKGINFLSIIIMFLNIACSNQKADDRYIIQIDSLGIRKGVFERRYKLAKDYKTSGKINSSDIKSFIDEIFLTDLLFLRRAYDLGYNKNLDIEQESFEFELKMLPSVHPIIKKGIYISKKELEEFKLRKKELYSFEIIQDPSFIKIDSLRKNYPLRIEKKEGENKAFFPRQLHFNKCSYGEVVPKEVYEKIFELKEGKKSKPFYLAGIWNIVKLTKKEPNKNYDKVDEDKVTLLKELENIRKKEQIEEFQDSLKSVYKIEIADTYYKNILSSFEQTSGVFNEKKYKGSVKSDLVIKSSRKNITVGMFFLIFNKENMFRGVKKISEEDIKVLIKDLSNQLALYLDVLDKKLQTNEYMTDVIENRRNKDIVAKFYKNEVLNKIRITDEMLLDYYNKNRATWKGEFKDIKPGVTSELKDKMVGKYIGDLTAKYKEEYKVIYNDSLINKHVQDFNQSKK